MLDKVLTIIKSNPIKLGFAVVALTLALVANHFYIPSRTATLSNGVVITLTEQPCDVQEIKDALAAYFQQESKKAIIKLPKEIASQVGQDEVKACYVEGKDKVAVLDELGNGGYVSLKLFK